MEYQIFIVGLCVIAWKDIMQNKVPNSILLILLLLKIVFFTSDRTRTMLSLEGFLLGGGFMLAGYLLSKGTMGAGDVKLLAVVGWYVGGDRILYVILWSLLAAAGYSLSLWLKDKTEIRNELPLAPFVLIGTILNFLLENRGVLC